MSSQGVFVLELSSGSSMDKVQETIQKYGVTIRRRMKFGDTQMFTVEASRESFQQLRSIPEIQKIREIQSLSILNVNGSKRKFTEMT